MACTSDYNTVRENKKEPFVSFDLFFLSVLLFCCMFAASSAYLYKRHGIERVCKRRQCFTPALVGRGEGFYYKAM